MPQSFSNILVHVVFSTKDRVPCLTDQAQKELHAYLATVARNVHCECLRVGGTADHVHLAICLARTMHISKLIEVLKTSSSKWLKTRFVELSSFAWQRGYGVFSADSSDCDGLLRYIDNQHEHHRQRTFKEEYLAFLQRFRMEYDERYLWD